MSSEESFAFDEIVNGNGGVKLRSLAGNRPDLDPFCDQVHNLLGESVDKIADIWLSQIEVVRTAADTAEKDITEGVARTKAAINRLHTLGSKVALEAKAGREMCERISDLVTQISGR